MLSRRLHKVVLSGAVPCLLVASYSLMPGFSIEGRTLHRSEVAQIRGGQTANRACDIVTACKASQTTCALLTEQGDIVCKASTETVPIADAKNEACIKVQNGTQCNDTGDQNDCAIVYDCDWDSNSNSCIRTNIVNHYERAPVNCVEQTMPGGT